MQKLNNLIKGSGKGKIAAIIGITSCNSFRKMSIKNVCLKLYQDYIKEYLGYDKVYIIATSDKPQKINSEYFDEDSIIFGISKENLFNDLNIDDIFCKQHALIFFGGILGQFYFHICNRLAEWYIKHGNGHHYTIQDDPDFLTINPIHFCNKRISEISDKDTKPYSYNHDDSGVKLYTKLWKKTSECCDNTIIAYCGNNYEQFFNRVILHKPGTPNCIVEPKYWDCFNIYNWQGVNNNLDEKFKDYEWEEKKYSSEYHGYVKHDKFRIETTLNFYNALNSKIMLIQGRGPFSDEFNNAELFDEVPYNELFSTIAKNAKTSFITANDSTWSDFISPRYFDLMLSDIIAFVYTPYDEKKEYTDNDELKEFMYVDTPEQFKERVEKLNSDKNFYKHIKKLQRESIYNKFKQYMTPKSKKKFEEKLR